MESTTTMNIEQNGIAEEALSVCMYIWSMAGNSSSNLYRMHTNRNYTQRNLVISGNHSTSALQQNSFESTASANITTDNYTTEA